MAAVRHLVLTTGYGWRPGAPLLPLEQDLPALSSSGAAPANAHDTHFTHEINEAQEGTNAPGRRAEETVWLGTPQDSTNANQQQMPGGVKTPGG